MLTVLVRSCISPYPPAAYTPFSSLAAGLWGPGGLEYRREREREGGTKIMNGREGQGKVPKCGGGFQIRLLQQVPDALATSGPASERAPISTAPAASAWRESMTGLVAGHLG